VRYQGSGVLVTGAAAGIGRGIAYAFLEEGATVLLSDFRLDVLDRAVGELRETFDNRVLSQPGDVRDARQVDAMFDALLARTGRLDVVVSNAGIYPNRLVVEMEEEEWDRVLDVNAKGTFLVCRAAARRFIAQGSGGKIITISSGAWRSGRRGAAHYCASKAAVVLFTQVLALELAPHKVNVNCIAPGLVEVEGEVSPISAEYKATLTGSIPWGRIGQPGDIARAALFLASDDADFITGEVLAVNGGSSAGRANLPLSSPDAQSSSAEARSGHPA
jgi:3-oxoacyl-[acyl-carrier protein] reductase